MGFRAVLHAENTLAALKTKLDNELKFTENLTNMSISPWAGEGSYGALILRLAVNRAAAVFTGTGLNDLTGSGTYSSVTEDARFTVIIEEVTGSITAFANAGGGQVTVTSNAHGLSNGQTIVISGTTSYNGTFTTSNVTANTFEITDTFVANDATGTWVVTPNTFKWKKDTALVAGAFTTRVAMTGSAQLLSDGVSVTFAATTGHTLNDQWTIDCEFDA